MTLHIDNLRGKNAHHQAETISRLLAGRCAWPSRQTPRMAGALPSTKGSAVMRAGQTIAVIDYGMGNLRSVAKAIEHVAAGAR